MRSFNLESGNKTTNIDNKIKTKAMISGKVTASPKIKAPPVTPNTGTSMIDRPLDTAESLRAT